MRLKQEDEKQFPLLRGYIIGYPCFSLSICYTFLLLSADRFPLLSLASLHPPNFGSYVVLASTVLTAAYSIWLVCTCGVCLSSTILPLLVTEQLAAHLPQGWPVTQPWPLTLSPEIAMLSYSPSITSVITLYIFLLPQAFCLLRALVYPWFLLTHELWVLPSLQVLQLLLSLLLFSWSLQFWFPKEKNHWHS